MPTKPKVAAEHLDAITGGANAVVDLDEAHRGVLRAGAANANADAVVAEIEAARLAKAIELLGDNPDAQANLERAQRIAAERRRRADGLAKKAGITGPADLAIDMRLFVANQLAAAQTNQVAAEEAFAHPDLWAVSDDEASLPRHPDAPPPVTADTLRVRALSGRAQIGAYVDWLNEHQADGPEPSDDLVDPARQVGVDALRRFMGLKVAAGADDDARTAAEAAKAAEDPRLGHTDL